MSGEDLRERHDEHIVVSQWVKRGTYHVNRYSTKVGYSFPGGHIDSWPYEHRQVQRTSREGPVTNIRLWTSVDCAGIQIVVQPEIWAERTE